MFECWWILPAVLLLLLPWLKDWYRLIKQVFNSWNHQKKQWIQSSIASIQRNQGCHRSWPISRLSAQNRFSPDERNTKNGLSANPSLVFMHQSSEVWNKTNWMTNSSWYLECESHCVIWIHIRKVILGILGKCGSYHRDLTKLQILLDVAWNSDKLESRRQISIFLN